MISLILTLIVLGIVFYFLDQLPMDPTFRTGVRIVAIIIVLLLLLNALGITGLPTLK